MTNFFLTPLSVRKIGSMVFILYPNHLFNKAFQSLIPAYPVDSQSIF